MILKANRRDELDIRNFERNLTSIPSHKKMIDFFIPFKLLYILLFLELFFNKVFLNGISYLVLLRAFIT